VAVDDGWERHAVTVRRSVCPRSPRLRRVGRNSSEAEGGHDVRKNRRM